MEGTNGRRERVGLVGKRRGPPGPVLGVREQKERAAQLRAREVKPIGFFGLKVT